MQICLRHNRVRVSVGFLAAISILVGAVYSGYAYSEYTWSEMVALNSLQQIRGNLKIIQALREGETNVAIDQANFEIVGALHIVKTLDSIEFSSQRETEFKYKTLSSLRKEWQVYPYPANGSCVYVEVQGDDLKNEIEKHCFELREYLGHYQ